MEKELEIIEIQENQPEETATKDKPEDINGELKKEIISEKNSQLLS